MDSNRYRYGKRGHVVIALDFQQNEMYPKLAASWLDIDRSYFGNCSTITVWSGSNISAIAVYSSYNDVNCEITVAATNKWWARKEVINLLLKYPFDQLGCQRTTLLIRESNQPVLRLAEKIGFEREGCLRQFYPDGSNCIVFGLLKSERRH